MKLSTPSGKPNSSMWGKPPEQSLPRDHRPQLLSKQSCISPKPQSSRLLGLNDVVVCEINYLYFYVPTIWQRIIIPYLLYIFVYSIYIYCVHLICTLCHDHNMRMLWAAGSPAIRKHRPTTAVLLLIGRCPLAVQPMLQGILLALGSTSCTLWWFDYGKSPFSMGRITIYGHFP